MKLQKQKTVATALVFLTVIFVLTESCLSRPDASAKFSIIREESRYAGKETLFLPYAFQTDSMGTVFGLGGMAKGYGQQQMVVAGTVFGSSDDARGLIAGLWDYRPPWTERFYFSFLGSLGKYPRQRAYTEAPRRPSDAIPPPAGTNDSAKDSFVEDEGNDVWFEFDLEYVLPIGSMKDESMAEYRLKNGILQSGATGGDNWNPLTSGISVFLLGQSSRYQSYNLAGVVYDGDTFPFRVGYLYDNTDFPVNPSRGSSQHIAFKRDFSDDSDGIGDWSFLEFEASKYFDLGSSQNALQRVLALNFWTGTSPSWEETVNGDGDTIIRNNPPFFEGANLGGFYRMRGYPNNRFNDRSVIYTTAEYRHTLRWNPARGVSWLRWLKLDWFQLVGFVEGGRVAGDYDSELLTDWKVDGGLGIRALAAGAVLRLDIAVSDEETTTWVMFGHPF
ncbi:MAG: BamA/TamA family outer membrane protein [Desulfopila sp.]|jgi:hypothetical protein|nr:BamA/TamA family outer membrane protein [Desulfopila sp.]